MLLYPYANLGCRCSVATQNYDQVHSDESALQLAYSKAYRADTAVNINVQQLL